MNAAAAVFWSFSAITVAAAAVVVLSKNLIYSAFALLFAFFGVAGLYLTLGADFLAATQLLIYVGGILVLLLFGVMLTHRIYDLRLHTEASQVTAGAFIAAGVFVVLTAIAVQTDWPHRSLGAAPTTASIGRLLLGQYLLPFWAASVLLLVALLGAAFIVRRRHDA